MAEGVGAAGVGEPAASEAGLELASARASESLAGPQGL